jgi:hypothetical protein
MRALALLSGMIAVTVSSPALGDLPIDSCAHKQVGATCVVRLGLQSLNGLCLATPFGGIACVPTLACAKCGDGVVTQGAGEQCDPGAAGFTPTCNNNCTLSVCGDGIVNPAAGEQCDPGAVGANTATCNSNCTIARCGDGIVNTAAGEQCDTAGESASCTAFCRFSVCGDGIVNRAA